MDVIVIDTLQSVVMTLLAGGASAAAGYLLAMLRKRSRIERATSEIIRALARKEIMDAYQDYVVTGRKLTVERFEQLSDIYSAYIELGGNGTVPRMWEEIQTKRPWIVTD